MSDLWPGVTQKPPPSSRFIADDTDLFAAAMGGDDEDERPTDKKPSYTCAACEDDSAVETVGSEVVCRRCGSIIDIPLEWSAEYRWFSSDHGNGGSGADPSRCGFPINHLMPESSLGTMILEHRQSHQMRRITRYHKWNLMPYRERALWNVFDGLQVRASNAGISNAVIEEVKELYAQLTASAICRGQAQRDAMLAACLWEALKRHEAPRMPKDIAEIFCIPLRNVTKGIKQFQHLLAIRTTGEKTDTYANAGSGGGASTPTAATPEESSDPAVTETAAAAAAETAATARALHRRTIWQRTATRTVTYEDFIAPFLTNLSVPRTAAPTLDAMVRGVCARTEELGVVPENTPPSLTASVIAFCSAEMGIRLDLAEIARVCGISVVTIQKCLKRMAPWKAQLLEVATGKE
jgi:transcription initiation factor TFIIIB Brf1 subunit/transcription initiation factor TFIIB